MKLPRVEEKYTGRLPNPRFSKTSGSDAHY